MVPGQRGRRPPAPSPSPADPLPRQLPAHPVKDRAQAQPPEHSQEGEASEGPVARTASWGRGLRWEDRETGPDSLRTWGELIEGGADITQ